MRAGYFTQQVNLLLVRNVCSWKKILRDKLAYEFIQSSVGLERKMDVV